ALAAARPEEPVAGGDALVLATSGTSGAAKAVVLTHDAVRAAAVAVSRRMEVDPMADRWLACLPLAHVGGLAVVARSLVTGTPLEVHATFDPPAVNASPATLTSVVPTMLDRGLRTDRFRLILVGGDADRRARPPNVVHTYGMTETGGGVVHRGRPLDGVEVRTDDGGQLRVRGPMLMRCYRDGTDPKDGDGWLPTGDLGRVVDGGVRVDGRLSNVIITGGEKVRPEEVELVLGAHPEVRDVAVAGRPDDEWGQRVVAWVVPRHPSRPPTLESLRRTAKEALPSFAVPKELVLVDELGRTSSGKLRRAGLLGSGP
ncbi:MAG: fatty acid--CoA ligase family protein, partial [Actinomycetota bacterium]|nr:fatty acid--CoA ligase family protein [Actinomycetota bacterium]MDQ3681028.1 fatty acid--CoA ligase family protein [Actinomycetota bacterium]